MVADSIQPIVAFMVLCSITIHGLSIPGFSLGRHVRSVSRTWSRQAPPEWLNQARIVSRGAADIVVNRDREDQMERGEMHPDEKDMAESPTDQSKTVHSSQAPDDGGSSTLEGQTQDDQAPSPTAGEETWPHTPRDGTELVLEWQEPHHTIIERRTSPGEDVRYLSIVHHCLCH